MLVLKGKSTYSTNRKKYQLVQLTIANMDNFHAFYHKATEAVCSSLDIQKSLSAFYAVLKTRMSIRGIMLGIACPSVHMAVSIQVGNLSDSQLGLTRARMTKRQMDHFLQLNASLPEGPLAALCLAHKPRPHWVDLLLEGEPGITEISQDDTCIVTRLAISYEPLGVLWVIAEPGADLTIEDAKLIAQLQYPLAVAVSSRMRATEAEALQLTLEEERRLHIHEEPLHEDLIGADSGLRNALALIRHVAPTNATVLFLGESGTGKERMAKILHSLSLNRDGPFLAMNCAALPDQLIESELFGHAKGAFTGAVTDRKGFFEMANGGSVLLDEVAELPLAAQAKLLRVLQEGEVVRVGESIPRKLQVRILAATHRNLEEHVRHSLFREDLYYRLMGFPIYLPPLRERTEDIVPLLHYFIKQKNIVFSIATESLPDSYQLGMLMAYPWPGNVRELEHAVERAVLTSRSGKLRFELKHKPVGQVQPPVPASQHGVSLNFAHTATPENRGNYANTRVAVNSVPNGIASFSLNLNAQARSTIEEALRVCNGKIAGENGAAALLGLHPNTLRTRMDKLGIPYGRKKA